ncbi:MAG: hypothetical protein OQL16_07470 [Gammaproteobacteria bacterium]|nr:hypothetical protein [Gammaproteobacteria bacterium]
MKVVPQIITFLILLVIGWYLYDSHSAFQALIDDIVDYSGVSREINRPVAGAVKPKASLPRTVESQQAPVAATPAADEVQPSATTDAIQWPGPSKPAESTSTVAKEVAEEAAIPAPVDVVTNTPAIDPGSTEKEQQAASAPVQFPSDVDEPVVQPVLEQAKQSPVGVKTESAAESMSALEPLVESMEAPKDSNTEESAGMSTPIDGAETATEMPAADTSATQDQGATDTAPEDIDSRKQKALAGLAAARFAWHEGNHDKAIMLYGQLVREFKNHPDFAGELGNIYFSKGEIELAVNAYSEAFLRLLRNNDMQRAELVLGIVYNIDQEQAALLREYLAH